MTPFEPVNGLKHFQKLAGTDKRFVHLSGKDGND